MFATMVDRHIQMAEQLKALQEPVELMVQRVFVSLEQGSKLLFCGNGGSAADSQHLAAEFVVRFQKNRPALAAMALTTDTSILTAHPNDFEFDTVFSRQVEALARKGDVLFALSTSGNSANVVKAAQQAQKQGVFVVAMTGENGGQLKALADISLCVPSMETARIQEAHMMMGHYLCEQVDERYARA